MGTAETHFLEKEPLPARRERGAEREHPQCQNRAGQHPWGGGRILKPRHLFSRPLLSCWCLPLAKAEGQEPGERRRVGTGLAGGREGGHWGLSSTEWGPWGDPNRAGAGVCMSLAPSLLTQHRGSVCTQPRVEGHLPRHALTAVWLHLCPHFTLARHPAEHLLACASAKGQSEDRSVQLVRAC